MTSTPDTTHVLSDAATRHDATAAAFIAEIRRHCADLPQDEIDELTDGLGADLADRLDEGAELGDPAEYAAELRAAAGLPPRRPAKKRASMRHAWAAMKAWTVATPRRRVLAEFFASLAPVWWVARGAMVAAVFSILFGGASSLTFLVLVGAVLVSVQWGRGRWQPNAIVVWLRRATSLGAILVILPVSASALGLWFNATDSSAYEDPWVQPGLAMDGQMVTNVFAYDCWGTPIDGVQLFDADGQPLVVDQDAFVFDEVRQATLPLVPNELTRGPGTWNVFPLTQQLPSAYGNGPLLAPEFPFEQVAALSKDCPILGTPEEMSAFFEEADPRFGQEAAARPDAKPEPAPEAKPESE